MYCSNCGTAVTKKAIFCDDCEEQTEGGQATSGGRIGYSAKIRDPAFAQYLENSKRWAGIFSILIAAAAIVGFYIAGELGLEDMENPQSLFIGLGIGGMFLLIGLLTILGRKRTRTWDGVVVDKIIKKKQRAQGYGNESYTVDVIEYAVIIKENSGKTHSIAADDDDTLYNYYQLGDRVRHHAGLNSYEKYDKSKDSIIFCNACATLCIMEDNYCWRCGCPLLK